MEAKMVTIPSPVRSILLLGLLMAGLPALADEQKVPLADVPKAVLDAVKARFPSAELKEAAKETEDGKTTYEVSLKDKGTAVDVTATGEGKIVEIERAIDARSLPVAVSAAVEARYPKASVEKAESIARFEGGKESRSFEVVLKTAAGKKVEVKLSPEGKVLEEENQAE
jgi:hypothetical protein